MGTSGMVSSPHYLATLAGLKVLQTGGSAVDAAIAVNSTLGVVYPHMTGMGGDAFWLIHDAETGGVHALNGSGRAVGQATRERYRSAGHTAIPQRGPLSAVTVPGAVDSWCTAHERFGKLTLADDLAQATAYARHGYPVSAGQSRFTAATADVLGQHDATARTFMPGGRVPVDGERMRFPGLADTMDLVAQKGRAGFYEGAVRDEIIRALADAGGYWEPGDLSGHESTWTDPVSTTYRGRTLYQHPPNSQGFVHLMVMNILENFDVSLLHSHSAEYVHLVVEATKLAFVDRDRYLTDPDHCDIPMQRLLSKEYAAELAGRINLDSTRPGNPQPMGQDTTCTVVVDRWGNAVSIIQSLYHEFGSAFVAGETGILLQNRGSFFSLSDDHVNRLEPGKRCFHTLMPGMMFQDSSLDLVYGTMGGEGQPQTSTALATRYVDFGEGIQTVIDNPRWLYGRTWGDETQNLRLENRFGDSTALKLSRMGHQVETIDGWSDLAGHAAAIQVDHHNGVLTGAADARGEGIAAGW
ncbi:MAG TPA: gamma-glutamyltransferase [Nocardioidaceae bacterium]|nr:gamma-glutamyltransferase [Nocardioidaceae bacterium]